MHLNKSAYLFILILLFLLACKEKEENEPQELGSADVIILNEGNFRTGNASIDAYNSADLSVKKKLFLANNQGRPLGDVAQSMIEYANRYYVVVNNSSKIEVLDKVNFQSIAQITGLNSPRYIQPIGNGLAYVSDLYEDKLYKIDLINYAIVKQLDISGWTEEMTYSNGKVFVCNMDSNQVLVIDAAKDSLIRKIPTNANPNSILKDDSGRIWVACSGSSSSFPAVIQIDGLTDRVVKRLEISDYNQSISDLELSSNPKVIYYLNKDVYKFSIGDTVLSNQPFISRGNRLFYSLGVDRSKEEIYVSDAIDYVQSGVIYRYDKNAQEIHAFRTGIIPGHFFFR